MELKISDHTAKNVGEASSDHECAALGETFEEPSEIELFEELASSDENEDGGGGGEGADTDSDSGGGGSDSGNGVSRALTAAGSA